MSGLNNKRYLDGDGLLKFWEICCANFPHKDGRGATGNWNINITGTAATSTLAAAAGKLNTNAGSATKPVYFGDGIPKQCNDTLNVGVTGNSGTTTALNVTGLLKETDITESKIRAYQGVGDTWAGNLTSMAYAAILSFGDPSRGWQLWGAREGYGDGMHFRVGNRAATDWSDERIILDSNNFNTYSPKLDGTGATGTWNINIGGNAGTATQLANTPKLWGQDFNGTTNVSGNMTGVGSLSMTGALTLTGTEAATAAIKFSRSGDATWNYIIWPGNSSDTCKLAFGYDTNDAGSFYYMTSNAFYPRATDTYSLGMSSLKWSNVYATNFTGNVTGNLTGIASKVSVGRGSGSTYRAIVVTDGSNGLYTAGTATGKPQYNYSTGDVKAKSFTTDGGNFVGNLTGNADTATTMSSFAAATGDPTKRYVWMSWNDNSGKPAYTDKLTFQTSTNTLFSNNFAGNLIGNATSATTAETATKLANKPVLAVSSTNSKQITVTAGENASEAFTVPYATTAGTAAKTAKTLTLKTPAETKTFDGSTDVTFEVTPAKLGLTKAVLYLGKSLTAITDGGTEKPTIVIDGVNTEITTLSPGNIVIDSSDSREYIWNGSNWEKFGLDGDGAAGNYKPVQTAIDSPSVSGNDISFIDTISQDINGVIKATRKTVRSATASQSGVVTTAAQTFAGAKTFNGGIIGNLTGNVTGNVTGNADTATNADMLDNLHASSFARVSTYPATSDNNWNLPGGIYSTSSGTEGLPLPNNGNHVIHCNWDMNVANQLFLAYDRDLFAFRRKQGNVWQPWKTVAFTSDIPTKVSQLTNDANYITAAGHTHDYVPIKSVVFTPAETAMGPADVLSKLGSGYALGKGTWDYAGNGYISKDTTGSIAIDLAGCSVIQLGSSSEYTQLYITAPTSTTTHSKTNEILFYNNHGSDYSPAWTRVLTNRNYSEYCASTGHTHNYLPKSGGTLTGGLTISGGSDFTLCADDPGDLVFANSSGAELARIYYLPSPSKIVMRYGPSTASYEILTTNTGLPLSGGAMTGNISYKGSKQTYEMIRFINNTTDVNGNGISIGGGGATIIGGGESASAAQSLLSSGGDDRMIICNDADIEFFSNCQSGIASRKTMTFNSSGQLIAGNFITNSDRRLKTNINEISSDKLSNSLNLNFVEFDYKDNNKHSAGHVAQEVKEVLPEFVHGNESETEHLSIDYTGLHSVQIKALKDEVDTLKTENKELRERLEKLEALIEKLV